VHKQWEYLDNFKNHSLKATENRGEKRMPESLKQFIVGFFRYWYVSLIPAYIFTPISIYELVKNDAWNSIHMPVWLLLSFFLITLIAACYLTYRDLWFHLPEDQRENSDYLNFQRGSLFVFKHFVRDELIKKWEGGKYTPAVWTGIHLEEAAKLELLPLYEKLEAGRMRPISFDGAVAIMGNNSKLFYAMKVHVRRRDLKRAWKKYDKQVLKKDEDDRNNNMRAAQRDLE